MKNPLHFISEQRTSILQTFDDLHRLAEPSWKEERTSQYIQNKLAQAGLSIQTFPGHFGFIAELKGNSNEVIALRADMDALVQEVNGIVLANHSCGHDAHSTMVLSTALALVHSNYQSNHTIRFIFQPAEEKAEGALQMIKDGALTNVKFLAGIHLRPATEISYSKAAPVILHGSSVTLKGNIKGEPSHASRPEEGNNPIEAAAFLIQAIRQIRLQDCRDYSIKVTELHGGEASNAIPENTRFTFDLRAEDNATMDKLIKIADHTIQKIAEQTETEITYKQVEYSPAAIKNPIAVQLAQDAIASILGIENTEDACISKGAEDFHFYTLENPNLVATMIGLGCDLQPGLHHPKMTFNKEALLYGTQILTKLILDVDARQ